MRPHEFGEWIAYAHISPWGEQRADLRSAVVASVIANVNRDTRRRPQPFKPADFMPFNEGPGEDADALAARIWGAFDKMKAAAKSPLRSGEGRVRDKRGG